MTVGELIARLEDEDPEAIVLVAHQPSWPLQEVVREVHSLADALAVRAEETGDPDDMPDEDTPNIVYVVADGHPHDMSPYAPKEVF